MTRRCLLLGLDGATFSLLDPLIGEGAMPFLGRLMASGARAELTSVIPPLTPPAWTSVMTGRSPGWHGILDFATFESPDSRFLRFINSRDVACETIWSVVSRQDRRAAALNFPATAPAEAINGIIIPGWTPWRWLPRNSHPREIFQELEAIEGFDLQTLAIRMVDELKAINGCAEEDYEPWIRLHTRREEQWLLALERVMQHHACDLTAVVFDGLDKIQHLCWRFLDPALAGEDDSPMSRQARALSLEYCRVLDRCIERLVSLAGPDATVLVVSDHGFGPTDMRFNVNQWLETQGLLRWACAAERADGTRFTPGVNETYQNIDWGRTSAYSLLASGNGIYLPRSGERGVMGVPESEYESVRESLAAGLLGLRDPAFDEPIVRRVWRREEAFAGPFMRTAPDLTVELRDWGVVSANRAEAVVERRAEIMGCHRPEGVFVVAGPGVRSGAALEPLSILDVAPTALYALGLPRPEDFEGRVAAEAFERDWLRAHPVTDGPPTLPPADRVRGSVESDKQGEEQIAARLRALGYEG